MKFLTGSLFALMLVCVPSFGATCPTTGNTNTDCGYILTIGPGGTVSGAAVVGANPYDGSDDALIGVVNNSGAVFNGSITLSGSGNGGGLFAFDGDGICAYTSAAYCVSAGSYAGPINTFTGINAAGTTGTVVFTGLAAGGTTFFSLEGSPASIIVGVGSPEPGTISMIGAGLAGFVMITRRRRAPRS